MANQDVPDPNNVPGAEGHLPASGEIDEANVPRDDPMGVGADRDGTDEGTGTDPLRPEQRQELIDDEHGPEDRLAGNERPANPDMSGADDEPVAGSTNNPDSTTQQSLRGTDNTDADQGATPDEPANPDAQV